MCAMEKAISEQPKERKPQSEEFHHADGCLLILILCGQHLVQRKWKMDFLPVLLSLEQNDIESPIVLRLTRYGSPKLRYASL